MNLEAPPIHKRAAASSFEPPFVAATQKRVAAASTAAILLATFLPFNADDKVLSGGSGVFQRHSGVGSSNDKYVIVIIYHGRRSTIIID